MNSDDNTIMTKIGGIGVYTIRLIFLMGQVACKMFVSYGLTYNICRIIYLNLLFMIIFMDLLLHQIFMYSNKEKIEDG